MADNKYPYSAELKAPADNSKVDYDDPKTIAGMAKIGKMFGKMAKFYHAKKGIQMKIGSYKSYDNADISFYLFEPKNSVNETLPCIIYYHGVENDWKSPLTQRLLVHRVEVMRKMLQNK